MIGIRDKEGVRPGAGGVGGLLMVADDVANKSYLAMNDYIGNVIGLIDPDNGTVAAQYEYDPFGRTIRKTGTYADQNPIRFSSQYTDNETGLVYFGFRYYHPQWGRFLNRDPIEEEGGANLYRFVSNDPVNRWDLLGLMPLEPLEDSLPTKDSSGNGDEDGLEQEPTASSDFGEDGEAGGKPFTLALGVTGSGAAGLRANASLQMTFSYSGGSRLSPDNYRVGYLASASPLTGVSSSASADLSLLGTYSPAASPEELSGTALNIGGSVGQGFQVGADVGNLGGTPAYSLSFGVGSDNMFGIPVLPAEVYIAGEVTQGASMPLSEVPSAVGNVLQEAASDALRQGPPIILTGLFPGFGF